ncbi:hypothetical protein J8F10_09900 [Gemmata sp. G18]|uniref:Polymer-forming cytoskeletal protein n=1 Tax=Gemmata palustris TaxID=2822762 RepID=A0ABS5BPK0_9BACT|nr:hypothetical protein [Gemmata palustris]MBP3955594.1 hypothetical protein [Gemmata palustris]
MTTLTCPKCRQGAPEAALDAGQCPACGFPLEGPVVLNDFNSEGRRELPVLLLLIVGGVIAIGAYAFFKQPVVPPRTREPDVTHAPPEPKSAVAKHLLPFSPEPQRPRDTPSGGQNTPKPGDPSGATGDKDPPQEPVRVVGPKKDGPRPIGVVMKVDPQIAPKRDFDNPDDAAALPDLNSGDRVVLTGKLRALKIGSVNGKGTIDASGLVAEEIVITGDLNGEAIVRLNAPNGKVTIGGYVSGASKLTVIAPGGAVIVLESSGRLTGSATTVVTAKRLEIGGKMLGSAKVFATLTAGGLLKVTAADEGATVTYKKAADSDPPIAVEKGTIRGGAKILAE